MQLKILKIQGTSISEFSFLLKLWYHYFKWQHFDQNLFKFKHNNFEIMRIRGFG